MSLFSRCQNKKAEKETAILYLNHHDSVNYVGINACKSCHLDKYQTFIETGMGQSFDSAHLLKTAANFKNVSPVYDSFLDLYYWPFIKDKTIYIKEYRLNGKDTVHSRIEEIKYIVGSGHHTNSHFIEDNNYVFQAPLTFYTQKGQWDLPPGFENGNNTRFNRKIGLECMSCHNALPNLTEQSDNQYRDLAHGIDCERCHGPGELHIQNVQKGKTVDITKSIDYSIVNPRKLSWQRQIDICQRCHLQGNAVLKPGKTFSDFKPGMILSETFDQFSPEYEGGDEFVMAAHAERFQKSKCFIQSVKGNLNQANSRIGFTCISCHNPHVSVRKTNHLEFNKVCASCHQADKKQIVCSDLPKNIALKNNNCVECHMPSSGTSDIPHVTVHDHYIRKPSAQKPNTGQLKGLRCITNKKPDLLTETRAYISYFEKFDQNQVYLKIAQQKALELNINQLLHLQTLIHLYYITSDYQKMIKLVEKYDDLKDDWSNYRIAKAYENTQNIEKAIYWMSLVAEHAPSHIDFQIQYAQLLIKNESYQQADQLLDKAITMYSKNPESYAFKGIIALKNSQFSNAKKLFLKALSLDPDLLLALQNLKLLYQQTNEKLELERIQKRIDVIMKRKK